MHPRQAEQLSAGQCDITRNAEHDGGRTPCVASAAAVVNSCKLFLPRKIAIEPVQNYTSYTI